MFVSRFQSNVVSAPGSVMSTFDAHSLCSCYCYNTLFCIEIYLSFKIKFNTNLKVLHTALML